MSTAKPEPCVIVIFGASGDLTSRKLIPALYEMDQTGALPKQVCVLGNSRTEMGDQEWRDKLEPWAKEHAKGFDAGKWREFAKRIFYFSGDAAKVETFKPLIDRIEALST